MHHVNFLRWERTHICFDIWSLPHTHCVIIWKLTYYACTFCYACGFISNASLKFEYYVAKSNYWFVIRMAYIIVTVDSFAIKSTHFLENFFCFKIHSWFIFVTMLGFPCWYIRLLSGYAETKFNCLNLSISHVWFETQYDVLGASYSNILAKVLSLRVVVDSVGLWLH